MAALSLIAGSILGWIAAAVALFLGTLASTALVVFIVTSLGFATLTLGAAYAIDTRTT
jgi:hypothetical protein